MNIYEIMDGLEEVVYFSNLENYELIFLNQSGKEKMNIQKDTIQGCKCYELLYGYDKPCKFCTREKLTQEAYLSKEVYQKQTDQYFIRKEKLIDTDKGLCQMALIYNVTDKQKNQMGKEKEKHDFDKLTKLYTEYRGKKVINDYLKNKDDDERATMFLIDIDHFSQINEVYGKVFGDAVLVNTAKMLKKITRKDDILIRIKDDIFLALLKNVNHEQALGIGDRVCKEIKSLSIGDFKELQIACSIGMVDTSFGRAYDSLYSLAESTLLHVKQEKPGSALEYTEAIEKIARKVSEQEENEEEIADLVRYYTNGEEALVSFAETLLRQTNDLNSAMEMILSQVGTLFDLNQIFIFETDCDYLCQQVVYKWSAQDEKEDYKYKTYYFNQEDFEIFLDFYKKRCYELKDIRKNKLSKNIQSIIEGIESKSGLFVIMGTAQTYQGGIFFEAEENDFVWTDAQKTTLIKIADSIYENILAKKCDKEGKAKIEFLSKMSHEIRTPMNAIIGMASIAKNMLDDKEKTLDCLEKIDESTKSLIDIVNEMLHIKENDYIETDVKESIKEGKQYSFEGKRVLLVEDNELNVEVAKTLLEMVGFEVEVAENGLKAVEIFEENGAGWYNVVLMDIRMPVMDGLEATRRIRISGKKDSRSIPIIALTANAFDEDTQKSIANGMNGHLVKPIDVENLYQVLKELV